MLDLLEILFNGMGEIAAGVGEVILGWRFLICLVAGVLIIMFLEASVESDKLCLALEVAVGVVSIGGGLIWDYRNGP